MRRRSDLRWWWTGALAAVLAIWIAGIASGLAFLDEPGGAVFARIAFMNRNGDVALAEQVGVWSMLVAAVAILTHLLYALALRSDGIVPLPSAAIASLAGMVMAPTLSAYALGMSYLPDVHVTAWFFFLLASAVVVATCGGLLWRIALDDRRRGRIERVPRARIASGRVEPRAGDHEPRGSGESRSHPE